ncbi:MAG: hypothetical protein AB1626_05335 [Candidatus Micrarchaeota archaeon]
MKIKDDAVTWFVRNVLLPRWEVIDKPGFVLAPVVERGSSALTRDVFIPETLLVNVENAFKKKFGGAGEAALYSSGKKFGYSYASLSGFTQWNGSNQKDFLNFAYFLTRYVCAVYAANVSHSIDLNKKTFEITLDDYIICSKNGVGRVMGDGGIAGIWAFMVQDAMVEGVSLACQGRGDSECMILCAPSKVLGKKLRFSEKQLSAPKIDSAYLQANQPRTCTYAKKSLKSLTDSGFFRYSEGRLVRKGERFFYAEVSLPYFLESELEKLHGGESLLFEAAFESGKKIASAEKGGGRGFLTDFLSALGYGDIRAETGVKPVITAKYYPFTSFSNKSRFTLFKGLCSGIISVFSRKRIEFEEVKKDFSQGYLALRCM